MDNNIFKIITQIRKNAGEEVGTEPRFFSLEEANNYINIINIIYKKIYESSKNNDISGMIYHLNEMLYLAFDSMAILGINPGEIIQSIVNAQLLRVYDDELHFNLNGVLTSPFYEKISYNAITRTYHADSESQHKHKKNEWNPHDLIVESLFIDETENDIETALIKMQLGEYDQKLNVNLLNMLYNRIMEMCEKYGFLHNMESSFLTENRVGNYSLYIDKLSNQYEYTDIHICVSCLGEIIGLIVNMFVEMGINPSKGFDEFVHNFMEKGINPREYFEEMLKKEEDKKKR